MQRLRSPFRLRPGPGADQRKSKTRREHGAVDSSGGDKTPEPRSSGGSSDRQGVPTGEAPGRKTIIGTELRDRRVEEECRGTEPPEPAGPDAGSGSE